MCSFKFALDCGACASRNWRKIDDDVIGLTGVSAIDAAGNHRRLRIDRCTDERRASPLFKAGEQGSNLIVAELAQSLVHWSLKIVLLVGRCYA